MPSYYTSAFYDLFTSLVLRNFLWFSYYILQEGSFQL